MKLVGTGLRREFRALRIAMQSIDRTLQRLASTNGGPAPTDVRRRRVSLTPKRRSALVLQGRYMGYMRLLKPRQKAQVREIREKMGVGPAIARAKRFRA